MATHSFKIDPSAPWDEPADEPDPNPASEESQQFSGLSEAGVGGYVVSTNSAAATGPAALGPAADQPAANQPTAEAHSQTSASQLGAEATSQTSPVPAITLVGDDVDEVVEQGEDDQPRRFTSGDDREISAESLIIARPKNPIIDRAIPVAIGLGLVMLLTFIFTEGLKVETWRAIVTTIGESQSATLDSFDSLVLAQIDQAEARLSQSLPKPQLMANPYSFLPAKAEGERWQIQVDRRPNLFNILKQYEQRDALGRYQLLHELRLRPHRDYAPIFTKALAEPKFWLKMEAIRGLISIDQPIPVYDLERRMAVVSAQLFRRYLRRLSPKTSQQDRILVRSLIKADLPWLRPSLLPLLKQGLSTVPSSPAQQLDRLFLAAAHYDKSPKVRRLSQNRQKDPAADQAYQKVWYQDLTALMR